MNTPSHAIITAALRKRTFWTVPLSAVLWGSVAPDVPLYLLSLGGFLYYPLVAGLPVADAGALMYDRLFYTNPLWVVSHNFLHAPLVLAAGIGGSWLGPKRLNPGRRWLRWFLLSCALHTTLDILTHHNDGPLLLFPFNWSLRFSSPVSYWDPAHYGGVFSVFELLLDASLLVYLLAPRFRRWRLKRQLNS